MSTAKKEKIEELLGFMSDPDLKKSHNRVYSSFKRMLAYIDKFQKPDMPEDIKFLLETYRDMADKFYTQYELSLLEKIKDQKNIQAQANQVILSLEKLPEYNPEEINLKEMIPLIEDAGSEANEKQYDLEKHFPMLLQKALDKLNDEWQRLNTMANASQTLEKEEELIQVLKVVVETAAFMVGIEAERITIVPGNTLALDFFTYLDNFAVLTVPIYSVQAPWEWSIFWHEIAGYKVRQIEKGTKIEIIKNDLENLYKLYNGAKDDESKELLKYGLTYFENSKKYIDSLFPDDKENKLDLSDLGGFEHQFERMLENLLRENLLKKQGDLLKEYLLKQANGEAGDLLKINNFRDYEQIKKEGWCVDWFKELFEDAWSVLAFGKPFMELFRYMLRRHVTSDKRHPTAMVREKVASELIKLRDGGGSDVTKLPKTVEESAAQQIFKLITLINYASSYKYFVSRDSNFIVGLMDRIVTLDDWLRIISNAIKNWDTPLNQDETATSQAEKIIKNIKKDETFGSILKMEKDELVPSYEKLLADKDYEQLLALSFFERDFFTFRDISTFTYGSQTKMINKTFPVPSEWNLLKGEVSFIYKDSLGKQHLYHTSKKAWNDFWEDRGPEYMFN
jgi:hypothetical protein